MLCRSYLKASAETIAVDVKDVSIIIHQDLKLGVGAVVWDCVRTQQFCVALMFFIFAPRLSENAGSFSYFLAVQ